MNNLDPEVAENPKELVVYGGRGKAARDWRSFWAIVESLKKLEKDRKSTRLNSSHIQKSRMPSSA